MRIVLSTIGTIVLILMITAFPLSLDLNNWYLFSFSEMINVVREYLSGLITGESWYFNEGKDRNPNFFTTIPDYFITSFLYLFSLQFCQ